MAEKVATKTKILQTVGFIALLLLLAGASIGITWAALTGSVKTSFTVSYTARNVYAVVSGAYIQGSGGGESLGADLQFSGKEASGIEKSFTTKPKIELDGPDDYVEFHYTIKNLSTTDGFGVQVQVTGFEDANIRVRYSSYSRATTDEATAQFHCIRPALTNLYVTPQGSEKSVLDIGIRVSIDDPNNDVSGVGKCNIFMDGTAEETVGDLFDPYSQSFDEYNVNKVLQQVSGDANANISNMTAITDLATNTATSADIIANYNKLQTANADGYSVSANSYDAEIIIELGDLLWTPVYLSKSTTGDTILTLWLVDNQQPAWANRKADEGQYYGFIDGALYGDWSANWYKSKPESTEPYRSNMYGTSYIRSVILNNGGMYVTSGTADATSSQSESNVFALFTMEKFGLTKFLVTPEHVAWQESGQTAKQFGATYNPTNQNWGGPDKVPDDDFYENYAGKEGNDTWKNDYLWLPSLSETGSNETTNGIWGATASQKALNYREVDKSSGGLANTNKHVGKGSTETYLAHHWTWLRSGTVGANNGAVCFLNETGKWTLSGTFNAHYSCAIRPAFHLNLTKIIQEFTKA